jgi:acyl carrier protein
LLVADRCPLIAYSGDDFMLSLDQTLDELIKMASAHFKVPVVELNPDEDFFKKLGINSLQVLDLLTKLENHFTVELPDYELQGVTDFRTLAGRIHSRLL